MTALPAVLPSNGSELGHRAARWHLGSHTNATQTIATEATVDDYTYAGASVSELSAPTEGGLDDTLMDPNLLGTAMSVPRNPLGRDNAASEEGCVSQDAFTVSCACVGYWLGEKTLCIYVPATQLMLGRSSSHSLTNAVEI